MIQKIAANTVITYAPFIRRNLNHIGGIHACAIATISEFATGLLILQSIDPQKYRLIMAEMKMNYHYQAKKAITAECSLPSADFIGNLLVRADNDGKTNCTCTAIVKDEDGNHIATGEITWQIKLWKSVATQL